MKSYLLLSAILAAIAGTSEGHADSGDSVTIGPRFHDQTSYGDSGLKTKAVTWGRTLPLYKPYQGKPRIELPAAAAVSASLDGLIRERRSTRTYAAQSLPLNQLAALLFAANGLTGERDGVMRRTFPSGGALYPTDLYVAATDVSDLAPGLYYFDPHDSSLVLLADGDPRGRVHAAANGQSAVASAPATLVLASRFDRITHKYADRGYRYAYIEIGAVCQNIYLAVTALGLGTVAVGAFDDDAANALFGFDGLREAVQLMMPVGVPARD